MSAQENPRLTQWINEQLEVHGLRLSARLPQMQRLERAIEMMCNQKGQRADTTDIAVISSMILLAFAMHEKPEEWTATALQTLPTTTITQEDPVRFTVRFGHPMTRRSQTKK